MPRTAGLGYDLQLPGLEDRDPYSEPTSFVRAVAGGDELELVSQRRPSELLAVNKVRRAVDAWRESGYDGASDTTKGLFQWWFEEAETAGFRPYWGQREALETLAYLVEIDPLRDVKELIERYHELP